MAEDIIINIEVEDQEVIRADQNVSELTESLVYLEDQQKNLKKTNRDLEKEQKELNKAYEEGSITTEDYEKQTQSLDKQIVSNSKTIAQNQVQIQKNRRERTANIKLMESEQGTRARLRQNIAQLTKELDSINRETVEGQQAFDRLTTELNQLNSELNEGSIASGNFKDNIGNYPQVMQPAANALELISGGIKGMIRQALAFIATPLGAVLTAITAAVGLFSSAVSRSASTQEKAARASGTLKGAWNFLLDQIGDLISDGFDQLNFAIDSVIAGLVALGILDKDGKFTQAIKDSRELEKAEQDLLFAEKDLEEQQLRSQIQAEKLRQIRDDDTKSIDDRIKANNLLGEALDSQIKREQNLANEVIRISRLRARVEGETVENLLAIRDAEIKLIEIQERVEGQRSEQLTNRNALLREKAELEKQDFDKRIEQSQAESELINKEIQEFEDSESQKQEILDRAFEQDIEREKKSQDQKTSIQDSEAARLEAHQKRLAEIEAKYQQQRQDLLTQSADLAGQTLGRLIADSETSFAQFSKNLILTALDFTEKIILLAIAETTAKQIASKGFAGIATGAILAGIIKGAFSVVKNQISGSSFAEGGTIINGPPHSAGGVDVFGSNGQYFGNVEGNESMFVLKKNATEALALSNLNESFGGRSFFSRPQRINQEGGQLAAQQATISPEELKSILQSVRIVVGVKDIIEGIDKRVEVLENARI